MQFRGATSCLLVGAALHTCCYLCAALRARYTSSTEWIGGLSNCTEYMEESPGVAFLAAAHDWQFPPFLRAMSARHSAFFYFNFYIFLLLSTYFHISGVQRGFCLGYRYLVWPKNVVGPQMIMHNITKSTGYRPRSLATQRVDIAW